jgi:hypothetical protein
VRVTNGGSPMRLYAPTSRPGICSTSGTTPPMWSIWLCVMRTIAARPRLPASRATRSMYTGSGTAGSMIATIPRPTM